MRVHKVFCRTCMALLIAVLLFFEMTPTAKAEEIVTPLRPEEARQAARDRVETQAATGRAPGWVDATLGSVIPLYDLKGEVSAFLFPVHQKGYPQGYLTVAAAPIPNPVLEFATEGAHPLSEGFVQIQGALDDLDLLDRRPLYLGLLGYAYELDSAPQVRRYYHLITGDIVEIPVNQVTHMVELAARTHEDLTTIQGVKAYDLIFGVPDWNQFVGSYGCASGCSPTAATNAMGYWDGKGYGNLIAGSNWQGAVNEMRGYMGTFCQGSQGATPVSNISPGMMDYALAHGYHFGSQLWCSNCDCASSYANYRGEINANHPMVVDIFDHAQYHDHSITGVGYDTNGTYMIVHDNWSTTGENVYLQYGSGYSYLFMHSLAPDSSPPVTTYTINSLPNEYGWFQSNVSMNLQADDGCTGSGTVQLRYKVDGSDWRVHEDSCGFSVSGEGEHIVRYQAKDMVGNWESEKRLVVGIDNHPPSGSLALNDGAVATHAVLTPILIDAADATSGVAEMRLRDAGGVWQAWEPYASRVLWQLPAVTGRLYTVEIQFKDKAGNLSSVYSDSVLLDIYPERPASAGYRLVRSTWGAAPEKGQSTHYRLWGTAGQPSLIGDLLSANYRLLSGYWSGQGRAGAPRRVYLPLVVRP